MVFYEPVPTFHFALVLLNLFVVTYFCNSVFHTMPIVAGTVLTLYYCALHMAVTIIKLEQLKKIPILILIYM